MGTNTVQAGPALSLTKDPVRVLPLELPGHDRDEPVDPSESVGVARSAVTAPTGRCNPAPLGGLRLVSRKAEQGI